MVVVVGVDGGSQLLALASSKLSLLLRICVTKALRIEEIVSRSRDSICNRSADVAVENFLMLLDDFFTSKSKTLAKDIEIHVRPHKSAANEVTSDLVESLSYEHLTFHEATAETKLPLKMFEAQPVVGKRVVTKFLQPESGTHVFVL